VPARRHSAQSVGSRWLRPRRVRSPPVEVVAGVLERRDGAVRRDDHDIGTANRIRHDSASGLDAWKRIANSVPLAFYPEDDGLRTDVVTVPRPALPFSPHRVEPEVCATVVPAVRLHVVLLCRRPLSGPVPATNRLEDDAVGVGLSELLPRGGRGRNRGEPSPLELPGEALARGLSPLRPRLAVVHHQRVVGEFAGGPERERPPADCPLVGDRAPADGAPGDRDRHAVDTVVDDLVIAENPEWVRPMWIPPDDDDLVRRVSEVLAPELRRVDARDGVPREDILDFHAGRTSAPVTSLVPGVHGIRSAVASAWATARSLVGVLWTHARRSFSAVSRSAAYGDTNHGPRGGADVCVLWCPNLRTRPYLRA
jgi:hypothetical protein